MARFRTLAKSAAASLAIVVLVLFGTGTAWAEFGKRYALVIGNSDYAHVERLPNTGRDAEAIAEALEALRFTVFKGIDITGRQFERLLESFDAAAADADTVVFYYAGHGFQLDGLNHLAPVDAVLRDRSRIGEETLVLDDIIERLHRPSRQTIVFLDACRNNPLPAGAPAGGEGLAQVGTGDGTFIAFATQPGNVSYDGSAKNSPFTEALLTHIAKPGRSISSLMIEVRNDVANRTLGRQVPWDQSSLRADFFFNPTPDYISRSEPAPGGIVIGQVNTSALESGGIGGTVSAPLPRPRPATAIEIAALPAQAPHAMTPTSREQLDKVAAVVASRALPDPAAAMTVTRALPDAATTTASVRAQPNSVDPVPGARTQADAVSATATLATVERLKPAREWFPEDEVPSPQEGDGEDLIAALDPEQPLVPEPEERPSEPLVDPRELARSIQNDLARLGCYRLGVDGEWGPGSRAGLEQYYREKGKSAPSLEPSTEVLAMLQEDSGTVCPPPKASPPKQRRVVTPAPPKKQPVAQKAQPVRQAAPEPQRQPAPAAKSPRILGF